MVSWIQGVQFFMVGKAWQSSWRQEHMTGPSQQDGAGNEQQGKSQNRYKLQRPVSAN